MIVHCAIAIHKSDGRCPDNLVGAEQWRVLPVVQHRSKGHKSLGYIGCHFGVRIRHGIQLEATTSVWLAEVNEHLLTLVSRPAQRRCIVGFPKRTLSHLTSLPQLLLQCCIIASLRTVPRLKELGEPLPQELLATPLPVAGEQAAHGSIKPLGQRTHALARLSSGTAGVDRLANMHY